MKKHIGTGKVFPHKGVIPGSIHIVTIQLPEHLTRNRQGDPRRVGFEIEFGGLSFEQCLDVLAKTIGPKIEATSAVESTIEHPEFGDFTLELDWQFLKEQAKDGRFEEDVIKRVADIAGLVVPLELVFPPIAFDRIDETDEIVTALREAGASGTAESPLYAFGVHINAEIPATDARNIVNYLQAYCILQDYLIEAHSIDASRRLSPYVDPYSPRYVELVLNYDAPELTPVIDDYLRLNPTRNRALDMLPMFAEVDRERVLEAVPDHRIKARPAFHYRMPNCDIGNPGWSLMSEWRVWCLIEVLANDSDELPRLTHEYRQRFKADQFSTDARWIDYIKGWADKRL